MTKPIVLIVDDEPSFGMRLKDAFVLSSMWGCLFVDDLSYALSLLERDNNIRILLADWRFAKGYSVKRDLYDGIDLISKVRESGRSDVHCFLMTAQETSRVFQRKISSLGDIPILFKQEFQLAAATLRERGLIQPGDEPDSRQPWDVIATNVVSLQSVRSAKKRKPGHPIEQVEFSDNGDRSVTYIQELNDNLRVREPIEIDVERIHEDDEAFFRASAPSLGLLVAGFGEDPLDAIKELQYVICEHYERLSPRKDLQGFARHTQELLKRHISRRQHKGRTRFSYG